MDPKQTYSMSREELTRRIYELEAENAKLDDCLMDNSTMIAGLGQELEAWRNGRLHKSFIRQSRIHALTYDVTDHYLRWCPDGCVHVAKMIAQELDAYKKFLPPLQNGAKVIPWIKEK